MTGNYSLHEFFRQKGLWWHPSDAEQQVFGELSRTPDSIRLEVGGSDDAVAMLESTTPDAERGLLHGILATKDNNLGTKKVTLVDVISSSSGPVVQTFNVGSALVGAHLVDVDALRFRKCKMRFLGLSDWLKCRPARPREVSFSRDMVVEVPQIASHEVRIDALDADIEFSQTGQLSWSTAREHRTDLLSFDVETSPAIVTTPSAPQNLDWFKALAWRLECLLSVLAGAPMQTTGMVLVPNTKETGPVHYLANLVYDGLPRRADASNTLFFFAPIEDIWSEILNKWFDRVENLRNAAYTLWSDILQPRIGVENRFLPLTQSIEGFSRAVSGDDTYLSEEVYESIKNTMLSAIPSDVPSDLRAKLKSQIRFANERSLRHRMRKLIDSLESDTTSLFCHDTKSFVEGIVATRNYWTHDLTEKESTVLDGERLLNACEQLHVFLLISFVKHLGVPEAIVRD